MIENAVDEYSNDAKRLSTAALQRVARYHRWIIAVGLAQVALWVGYLILTLARGDVPADGLGFPTVLTFILGGVGGIFAFLLYWTVRGPIPAVIMGLGAIPPCIGLLVLVVVNSTATSALKANGVEVGMFGADAESIPDDYENSDEDDAGW